MKSLYHLTWGQSELQVIYKIGCLPVRNRTWLTTLSLNDISHVIVTVGHVDLDSLLLLLQEVTELITNLG